MRSFLISSLLAAAASASSLLVERSHTNSHSPLEVRALRRDDQTTTAGTNSSLTMAEMEWDAEVQQACMAQLSMLDQASNPSGVCVCYNIPSFNTQTGRFSADLRLYQISEPTGIFAGIPPSEIQVGVTYAGAGVTRVTPQPVMTARDLSSEYSSSLSRRDSMPQMLQMYLFLGQVNLSQISNKSMSEYVSPSNVIL